MAKTEIYAIISNDLINIPSQLTHISRANEMYRIPSDECRIDIAIQSLHLRPLEFIHFVSLIRFIIILD